MTVGTLPGDGPQLIDGLWLRGVAGGTNRQHEAGLIAFAGNVQAGAKQIPPQIEIVEFDGQGPVGSVTVVAPGSGYTTATARVQSSTGSGAVLTAALSPVVQGAIQSVTVTNGGTGYTTAPTAAITTTTGSGATLTPVIAGGVVTGVTVTAPGSGYAPTDTVAITGGGGTGATARLTVGQIGGAVTGITVTTPGTNYLSTDRVVITGNGAGAIAFPVITSAPGSCLLPLAAEPGTLICLLNTSGSAISVFANTAVNRVTNMLDMLNGSPTVAYSVAAESLAWFACAKAGFWIGK